MVQNLRSRLIQPTASCCSSRCLSWSRSFGLAYPSRSLPWTWKCSYKCTKTLSAACWSRERLLARSVFNYFPDLHGPDTHAALAGIWPAARESRKFRLNSTLSIACSSLSKGFKPLDLSLKNFSSRFPHKFHNSLVQILTRMLIWNEKDSVEFDDFPDQSQSFRFACSTHCCKFCKAPKQTTLSLDGLAMN